MAKNQYRIAVIGATTLLGKEIGDEIAESPLASATTVLLDTEDASGTLEAMGDEAAFIQTMEPAALEKADVAIFADAGMLREYGRIAQQFGAAVVDATGTQWDKNAPVRSPLSGQAASIDLETTSVRVAHPVATMLALVLGGAVGLAPVRFAAATVLQPASEGGSLGVDELQQQTVSLLSFQTVPTAEFDAQVAFNLLPSLGEAAKAPLGDTLARIRNDFATLAGGRLPEPLVQLIHAPVFHGFAVSLFLEFERPLTVEAVSAALKSEHIDIVGDEVEPPSNLSSAGQAQVLVQVKADDDATRFVVWLTADNLKLAARTAVACALELTRLRPLGIVQ